MVIMKDRRAAKDDEVRVGIEAFLSVAILRRRAAADYEIF